LDISSDGRRLLYIAPADSSESGLYVLPLDGAGVPNSLPGPWPSRPYKPGAKISPNGRWLAYASAISGRSEIYVRSFSDTTSDPLQVSSQGGIEPQWRHDGRELFFVAADQKLMAVPVTTDGAFHADVPIVLFSTGLEPNGLPIAGRNQYVVSADGRRFLLNQPHPDSEPPPATVLMNWLAALKQ
jgi:Tol biopolymer transport system component